MCVCVCVCVCVCACEYVCGVYLCACVCLCVCVREREYVCVHVSECVGLCVSVCACMCVRVRVCINGDLHLVSAGEAAQLAVASMGTWYKLRKQMLNVSF